MVDRCYRVVATVGIDIRYCDRRAETGERFCEVPAEAAPGPGDQNVPVTEIVLQSPTTEFTYWLSMYSRIA
jgi:hypothetical protein